MENYRATPEQWETIAEYAKDLNSGPTCLLELRNRVEALEAANSKPTPNPSQIRSSLVERVRKALSYPPEPYARAAIREVAAWMTSNPDVYFPPALVFALEQEAEQ